MAKSDVNIFVDSNFFIALYNKNDTLFDKAIQKAQKIQQLNSQIFISNYIFAEITTIISQRISKRDAIIAGERIIQDPDVSIFQSNKHEEQKAWELFKQIRKKNISYVDCTTLSLMEKNKISTLLTFDTTDFSSLKKTYKFSFF